MNPRNPGLKGGEAKSINQSSVVSEIFPPMPTIEDENYLEELIDNQQVPILPEVSEPVVELTDLRTSESDYYKSFPIDELQGIDSKLLEFDLDSSLTTNEVIQEIPELMQVDEASDIIIDPITETKDIQIIDQKVDMEQELFNAFENLSTVTRKPPISPEDLLTLLTFNSSTSVGVPPITTTQHPQKSLLNELLLLRLPSLFTFFGGEKVSGLDVQILEEIQSLQKHKKREKERDSGQGKAPIKMSEARKRKIKALKDEKKMGMSESRARKEALQALAQLNPGN